MEPCFVLALSGLPDAALAARLCRVLPAAEWQWIQRLHRPEDRLRSLCGRAALRILLAPRLGLPTTSIPLCTGPWGKPMLASPAGTPPDWHFNIAHSADQVLLAIGRQALGVDVEACPKQPDHALYRLVTGHAPQSTEQAQNPLDFCRQWVCREAILKACGMGLNAPMGALRLHPSESGWWRVSGLPAAEGLLVRQLWQSTAHCAALCLPDTASWQLQQHDGTSWFYTRI
ncbi:hypothetical protein [Castellaniella sp.]|uniref:4'-phosphopantetheinyl transferase family protein n=1 Tax=Castellaniella sp. TaxID=1955812 RepID=UPI002AFDD5A3|nr:hypothetical protein [Castellaniella sp.]